MKWISRAILVLMIAAGGALVAFGPRPHGKAPPGAVVVSYWEKWTAEEALSMKEVVDDFNRTIGREKNIFVEYVSLALVDRKTLTATAAGVPPDIAGMWPAQVVPYALAGALEPLDELAASYGISADDYKKVYWDIGTYHGRLFALPTTPSAVALHYNKRIFYENADRLRARGLDPTRPPRTIDEFTGYAEALDTFIPGTHRLDRAGYFTMEPGWWIVYSPIFFGQPNWDRAAERYNINTPSTLAAMEWVASFSRRHGRDALTDFRSGLGSFNSDQNPFFIGKVAMVQQGPWMANYIRNKKPDISQVIVPFVLEPFLPRVARPFNYAWAAEAFPSAVPGKNDVTMCDTDIITIPRGAKHKREAFEFIAYTQRREVMEKLCRLQCKHSPLKATSDEWVYTHTNPYIEVFDRLAASPNALSPPNSPIGSEVNSELDYMAQRVYLMQTTPKHAVEEAQKRVEAKMQRLARERALDGGDIR